MVATLHCQPHCPTFTCTSTNPTQLLLAQPPSHATLTHLTTILYLPFSHHPMSLHNVIWNGLYRVHPFKCTSVGIWVWVHYKRMRLEKVGVIVANIPYVLILQHIPITDNLQPNWVAWWKWHHDAWWPSYHPLWESRWISLQDAACIPNQWSI